MRTARRICAALRDRPIAELRGRALQAGRAAVERAGLSSDLAAPTASRGRAEFSASAGRPSVAGTLEAFRAGAAARFFPGTADPAGTAAAIRLLVPEAESRAIELAEGAARGRFRLLGYDALDFGQPSDWHLDPVRGRRATLAHWSRIPYMREEVVGDPKVIWELNRHQWLVHLARAYLFTGDERWAEAAFASIDAWIAANPPKRGINWASSLEVAFRAIAWLWTLHLLRDARALTQDRFERMVRVLAVGGRHIEHHLSTWYSPNTHLTGEAMGLAYLGFALPGLRDAPRWRALGLAILRERMPQHVRDDGSYVEQSTHYARYTVDFLIHAVILAGRSSVALPVEITGALRRGAAFVRHVARPDGSIPLIGDDDGGRLLFLGPEAPWDVRPTLAAAAVVLGDASLANDATPIEEVAWLLGPDALARLRASEPAHPDGGSRIFADGGIATLRDGWGRRSSLAVLDCGSHGMGKGAHAHADLGSIDLTLGGRPVVSDPGTWSYLTGGGARDSFRGAGAHAVALVDGQGTAEPGDAFSWMRVPRVLAFAHRLSPSCDVVAFTHDGFCHLDDPVGHRRAVLRVRGDYWLVIDAFRGARRHEATIRFPLAAGLEAKADGASVAIRADGSVVGGMCIVAGAGAWAIEDGWTSTVYGRRDPARRLAHVQPFEADLLTATLVHAGEREFRFETGFAGARGEWRLSVREAGGLRDDFVLGPDAGSLVDGEGRGFDWKWPAPMAAAGGPDGGNS